MKITKKEHDIAVRVMSQSKLVQRWVKGQAAFLEVNLNTPQGKEFLERESIKAAQRIVR